MNINEEIEEIEEIDKIEEHLRLLSYGDAFHDFNNYENIKKVKDDPNVDQTIINKDNKEIRKNFIINNVQNGLPTVKNRSTNIGTQLIDKLIVNKYNENYIFKEITGFSYEELTIGNIRTNATKSKPITKKDININNNNYNIEYICINRQEGVQNEVILTGESFSKYLTDNLSNKMMLVYDADSISILTLLNQGNRNQDIECIIYKPHASYIDAAFKFIPEQIDTYGINISIIKDTDEKEYNKIKNDSNINQYSNFYSAHNIKLKDKYINIQSNKNPNYTYKTTGMQNSIAQVMKRIFKKNKLNILEEEKIVGFIQKRAGDELQVLAVNELYDDHSLLESQLLYDNDKIKSKYLYFITHDRLALIYALLNGVNVIYTTKTPDKHKNTIKGFFIFRNSKFIKNHTFNSSLLEYIDDKTQSSFIVDKEQIKRSFNNRNAYLIYDIHINKIADNEINRLWENANEYINSNILDFYNKGNTLFRISKEGIKFHPILVKYNNLLNILEDLDRKNNLNTYLIINKQLDILYQVIQTINEAIYRNINTSKLFINFDIDKIMITLLDEIIYVDTCLFVYINNNNLITYERIEELNKLLNNIYNRIPFKYKNRFDANKFILTNNLSKYNEVYISIKEINKLYTSILYKSELDAINKIISEPTMSFIEQDKRQQRQIKFKNIGVNIQGNREEYIYDFDPINFINYDKYNISIRNILEYIIHIYIKQLENVKYTINTSIQNIKNMYKETGKFKIDDLFNLDKYIYNKDPYIFNKKDNFNIYDAIINYYNITNDAYIKNIIRNLTFFDFQSDINEIINSTNSNVLNNSINNIKDTRNNNTDNIVYALCIKGFEGIKGIFNRFKHYIISKENNKVLDNSNNSSNNYNNAPTVGMKRKRKKNQSGGNLSNLNENNLKFLFQYIHRISYSISEMDYENTSTSLDFEYDMALIIFIINKFVDIIIDPENGNARLSKLVYYLINELPTTTLIPTFKQINKSDIYAMNLLGKVYLNNNDCTNNYKIDIPNNLISFKIDQIYTNFVAYINKSVFNDINEILTVCNNYYESFYEIKIPFISVQVTAPVTAPVITPVTTYTNKYVSPVKNNKKYRTLFKNVLQYIKKTPRNAKSFIDTYTPRRKSHGTRRTIGTPLWFLNFGNLCLTASDFFNEIKSLLVGLSHCYLSFSKVV